MLSQPACRRLAFLGVMFTALCGCETIGNRVREFHRSKKECEAANVDAGVYVGGSVQNPGRISLPEQGLTLKEALSLAGNLRPDGVPVMLRRNEASFDDAVGKVRAKNAELMQRAAELVKDCDSLEKKKAVNVASIQLQTRQSWLQDLLNEDGSQAAMDLRQKLIDVNSKINSARNKLLGEDCDEMGLATLQDALNEQLQILQAVLKTMTSGESQTLAAASRIDGGEYLVALSRPSASRKIRYFFLYDEVAGGAAGAVPLENGDFVDVVRIDDTTLNARASRNGPITVTGFVDNPGFKTTNEAPLLGSLFQSAPGGGRIDTSQLSVVLRRTSSDGFGQDVYVLPYLTAGSTAFRSMPTMPADIFEVVPTFRAPLILETTVGAIVEQAVADTVVRRIPLNRGRPRSIAGRLEQLRSGDIRERVQPILSIAP